MARIVSVVGLAAVAVVSVVLASGGGSPGHRVYVTVAEATNVIAGQEVRSAGEKVGRVASIDPVRGGRAARLAIELGDEAWPLPRGTKFALRWGGTISYSNRFVAVTRPARGGPPLRDGETIPTKDFTTPVEIDELVGTFTAEVRRDMRSFIRRGGVTFATARPELKRTLAAAPAAVREATFVLADLEADQRALDTLVRSSARVVDAIDTADPGIGDLVAGADTTFTALAGEATSLQATLERAPRTLTAARATLARADRTLGAAAKLTDRLAPGVDELRRIARPLNNVIGTVVRVGPDARATLATAGRATADLNPLLVKATELAPRIGSIGKQSATEMRCIRPYTPDIVSFFTNWGDFFSPTDGTDKYLRASVQTLVPAGHNVQLSNSAEAARMYPGLRYAFPRPPGYNAGQPWFLPECGAGPDALDPSKDPEAGR